MKQQEQYELFRDLHFRKGGFIMPNVWDGGSAALLRDAGFEATATSSAAFAFSLGRLDGRHQVSREEEIGNAQMIGRMSGLPVNGDFEDGFAASPTEVMLTVTASIEAGLAGLGIEDTTGDPQNPIHDFDFAVKRVQAAAKAAKGKIMLTGRTDNFLYGINDLDDTIRRLVAFAEVGADVLYAPLLPDMEAIKKVLAAVSPKPVNVLIGPKSGAVMWPELQAIGVHRVSIGLALYSHALAAYQGALAMLRDGDLAGATKGIATRDIVNLIQNA